MRLLVTGGRHYADAECVAALLGQASRAALARRDYIGAGHSLLVVHGACGVSLGDDWTHDDITGADGLAHRWARWNGANVLPIPADWCGPLGLGAGPARNAEMVRQLVEAQGRGERVACLSFPGGRGTADCTQRAVSAGVWVGAPVRGPDGWDVRWWHRDGRSRGPALPGLAADGSGRRAGAA